MNLRIVSIFLLFLFSIVIAFPGYGSSARPTTKKTNLYASQTETGFASLKRILKKCLVKGINMIEEERSTEEDETGGAVVFEYMAFQGMYQPATLLTKRFAYTTPHYPSTALTIFTPPDCFFN